MIFIFFTEKQTKQNTNNNHKQQTNMFYFLSFFDFCISFIFSLFLPAVLASKIWDDFSMDNSDFAVVWKPTTLKRVNQLERKVLELLRYNVSIPASDYAACYFKLRSLVTSLGLKEDELQMVTGRFVWFLCCLVLMLFFFCLFFFDCF